MDNVFSRTHLLTGKDKSAVSISLAFYVLLFPHFFLILFQSKIGEFG